MLVAPAPLFPKLALLAASTLGFGIALLATPTTASAPAQPRLLGTYVYDPGGYTGAIIDFGEGPVNLPLGEFREGAYLVSVNDYQAIVRIKGERHFLPFARLQSQDYARREAPAYPPGEETIGGTCGTTTRAVWHRPEPPATQCTTKRGSLWTPTPCAELRGERP